MHQEQLLQKSTLPPHRTNVIGGGTPTDNLSGVSLSQFPNFTNGAFLSPDNSLEELLQPRATPKGYNNLLASSWPGLAGTAPSRSLHTLPSWVKTSTASGKPEVSEETIKQMNVAQSQAQLQIQLQLQQQQQQLLQYLKMQLQPQVSQQVQALQLHKELAQSLSHNYAQQTISEQIVSRELRREPTQREPEIREKSINTRSRAKKKQPKTDNSEAELSLKKKALRNALFHALDNIEGKARHIEVFGKYSESRVDLDKLRSNVESGRYNTVDQLKVDFRKMCNNTLNSVQTFHEVYQPTLHLFMLGMKEIIKQLPYNVVEGHSPCQVCKRMTYPNKTLLCDNCNDPYHMFCLPTPLEKIPTGSWFCPTCERYSQNNALQEFVEKRREQRKLRKDNYSDSGWSSDEESEAPENESSDEGSTDKSEASKESKDNSSSSSQSNNETITTATEATEAMEATEAATVAFEVDALVVQPETETEQKGEKRKLEESKPSEPPSKRIKLNAAHLRPTVRRSRPLAYYTSEVEVSPDTRLLAVQQIIGNRWKESGGRKQLQLKLSWEPVDGVQPEEIWVYKHNTQGIERLVQTWNHRCFQGE